MNNHESKTSVDISESETPRYIRISRSSKDDLYGFEFITENEKEQMRFKILNVKINSPGFKGGIRNNDYIIEINDESTQNMNLNYFLTKVNQFPNHVDLLVVSNLKKYLQNEINEIKF